MEAGRDRYFWEKMRGLFLNYLLKDWETLYRMIAFGYRRAAGIPTFSPVAMTACARAGFSGETG